jgi:hypothetical protein
MPITTICPGCSATLQIEEAATSATCPYCGNHFEVKMDGGAAPELRKAAPPPPAPEPLLPTPVISEPPTSVVSELPAPAAPSADPDASGFYNPPIPGASPIIDLYNPPLSNAAPPPGGNYAPPSFYTPSAQKSGGLSGSRLWIAIAIAVFAIFCISCLCMVAILNLMVR